jgi:hypothetical protein
MNLLASQHKQGQVLKEKFKSLFQSIEEKQKRAGWSKYAQLAAQAGREAGYVQEFARRMAAGLLDDDEDIQIWTDNLVDEVWQARGGDLRQSNQRFFKDLYDLLARCGNNVGKATKLLQSLQKSLSKLPKGTHVPVIIEFCHNLEVLVKGDDLQKVISEQQAALVSLSDRNLGVVDALYVYDFYRRVGQFFEEVDQGKDPWVTIPPRDYGSSYSPMAIELAHAVLDNLRSADKPPIAYLWRFLEALEGRQTPQRLRLTELPLPERVVCKAIIDRVRELIVTPGRLTFDLRSANQTDYNSVELTITNASTSALRGTRLAISPPYVMGNYKLKMLEALQDRREHFRIDHTASQPSFTVQVRSEYGENSWRIARDRMCKPYPGIEVPHFDMRWYPTNKRWTVDRRKLLEELRRPLESKQLISARFLCGIPRVGKTSLLQDLKQQLQASKQQDCLVCFLDLQLILPLWPKQTPGFFDGSEIKRFLRDMVTDLNMPDLSDDLRTAFIGDLAGKRTDEMLEAFADLLAEAAKGRQIVLLLDEFSLLVRSLESTDSLLLKKLLETLGPRLKGLHNQLPIHYIICGAEDLPDHKLSKFEGYPLLSSIDPRPILVGGLSRDEINELVKTLLRNKDGEPLDPAVWFDDLALDLVETYTGGHPLLVQLILRGISELIQLEKIAVPLGGPEIYQLLYAPVQERDEVGFWVMASKLRDTLDRAASMIWEGLAEDTRERLSEVLDLRTMNGVSKLENLGLLSIANNGMPRIQIGALERVMKTV